MDKIDRVIELLEAILEALSPEPIEEPEYTCPCARNGSPVSNCPLCRGTGVN